MGTLENNIFNDINNFKELLAISKVIKFFEIKGITVTKTMIQNYSKIGILPPLIDKRYYGRNHLVRIYIIYILKNSFSLEEIRGLFSLVKDDSDLLSLYQKSLVVEETLAKIKLDYIATMKSNTAEVTDNEFVSKLVEMNNVIYFKNSL